MSSKTRTAPNPPPASTSNLDTARLADLVARFEPLGARVLVQQDQANDRSAGGIIIPEASRPKPLQGVVLAVGPGRELDNGATKPCELRIGDRILFPAYAGSEVRIGETDLLVIDVAGVLGRFRS